MTKIEFENVGITFPTQSGGVEVLRDVSLDVEPGEFLVLLGPSGCGKSTLLNMAGGLLQPTAGRVRYGGRLLDGVNTAVGYVTQRDNLLPWRTARGNIELPLEIRHGREAGDFRERVDAIIEMLGLGGFGDFYPGQLSGGMRKRVTLARTLIYEPETILMDEPFGALDAQLRQVLQAELLRISAAARRTTLFVTHDISEAVTLADRVAIFSPRPGTIKHVQRIDLDCSRDPLKVRFEPQFNELTESLWQVMGDGSAAEPGRPVRAGE